MRRLRPRGFSPRVDGLESRRLLSVAVAEVLNKSSYNINFDFRWTPSSPWSAYTEAPGQGEIFSTSYSSSLTPQVLYNTSTAANSQVTVNLVQGYGQWNGSGAPPASAASLYEFQNTSTGLQLYFVAPPTPTQAVVEVLNQSNYTITFQFRWSSSSSWSTYTEGPGQGEIFWTTYSSSLVPQALYDATTSPGSQLDVTLAQGYGQWTGTGTPPASAASLYTFQNNAGGVTLYYGSAAPAPTPSPAPNAIPNGNWSGYVAAANLSSQPAGSVTYVAGTWNVPSVSGPSSGTYDSSTWVGIDGYGNQTVEQLGTEQDMVNGQPVYRAWWEMYSSGAGQPEQIIPGMIIGPGDSITATVQYITSGAHAGQYYMTMVDNSRSNDSFSTYQTSASTQSPLAQGSCAEWIMEAPSVNGQISQTPNFSPVRFTNASVTINGSTGPINSPSWQSAALNLVQNGTPIDTTSTLGGSGGSFTVTCSSGVSAGVQSGTAVGTGVQQQGSVNPQVIVVGKLGTPTPTPAGDLSVGGQLYLDQNGDGAFDAGDIPLAGRAVYLDVNNSGVYAPGDPTAVTGADGRYALTAPGYGVEYTVRLANYAGESTNGAPGGGSAVLLIPNQGGATVDLAVVQGDTVQPLTASAHPFGTGPADAATAEITALYTTILGRAPDSAGLASWVGALRGGWSLAQVAEAFFHSPQYETRQVAAYYDNYLGRDGSAAEVASWVNYMQSTGASAESVAALFLTCPAYNARHAADADFIESLYTNVLDRPATAADMSSWEGYFQAGGGRAFMVQAALQAAETLAVEADYTIFLGRPADPAGLAAALATLQHGWTLADLASYFVSTPEFAKRAAAAVTG